MSWLSSGWLLVLGLAVSLVGGVQKTAKGCHSAQGGQSGLSRCYCPRHFLRTPGMGGPRRLRIRGPYQGTIGSTLDTGRILRQARCLAHRV